MRPVFIICLIFLLGIQVWCQENHGKEKHTLIQFSGIVKDELLQAMAFAHIFVLNKNEGVIATERGMFSFVVTPGDSVRFTGMGYKPLLFIVPDTLPNAHLTADVLMLSDTIRIEEINIYPWKTYDDLKTAILALNLESRDIENAKKNIAIMQAQIILDHSPNPNVNYRQVMNEQYNKVMVKGELVPTYSILNPFAWAKFIEALQTGGLKDPAKN